LQKGRQKAQGETSQRRYRFRLSGRMNRLKVYRIQGRGFYLRRGERLRRELRREEKSTVFPLKILWHRLAAQGFVLRYLCGERKNRHTKTPEKQRMKE